ncbi:hypothetical protein [Streptomyces tropicalis]|uniref:Integral membrane protein n=1 Tax=Streptomyces tropicalis TaxID=3034234 RepID=A0ABT5ZZG7_9ACTN|nr:hypothetical protein [Streptomyces tropicalis]MDF3297788.1 hypothetical protein [Streptomyces tropicalis]
MRPYGSVAAVLCAAAVLLLGGCGTQVAGRGGGTPATATGPLPWTLAEPSSVLAARLGTDRRTLSLDAPVPAGPRPCVRGLRAVVTDTAAKQVWVQVTFASPSGDRRSGCTGQTTATARVRLPQPLEGRDLIVDHYTVFTADGAKPPALRRCGQLGCRPPATGCTPASYEQALFAVGAPRHTYRDAEHCDGAWLVLDFSWRTGPACAGDTTNPACSSRLGDRYFFRAEHTGWKPFLESTAGGCRAVRRREPAFPPALCTSLAPLPASLHPSHPPSASPTAGGDSH